MDFSGKHSSARTIAGVQTLIPVAICIASFHATYAGHFRPFAHARQCGKKCAIICPIKYRRMDRVARPQSRGPKKGPAGPGGGERSSTFTNSHTKKLLKTAAAAATIITKHTHTRKNPCSCEYNQRHTVEPKQQQRSFWRRKTDCSKIKSEKHTVERGERRAAAAQFTRMRLAAVRNTHSHSMLLAASLGQASDRPVSDLLIFAHRRARAQSRRTAQRQKMQIASHLMKTKLLRILFAIDSGDYAADAGKRGKVHSPFQMSHIICGDRRIPWPQFGSARRKHLAFPANRCTAACVRVCVHV